MLENFRGRTSLNKERAYKRSAVCTLFASFAPIIGTLMHLSMLSPRGGGIPGICGAFDFSEEFLVKIPTVGPENLVKSDQISSGVRSIYI